MELFQQMRKWQLSRARVSKDNILGYGAKSAREALQQRETFKIGIDFLIAMSSSADDSVTVCIR